MPIYIAQTLEELIIKRVSGNDKVKAHLANLGLVPGETVMLVNKINDNVIIKIKGVSLAISNELAKRIFV